MPLGWNASFSGGLTERAALVGDIGGNYKSEGGDTLRLHTFMAGVRIGGPRSANVVPFAQVLAGLGHAGGDGSEFFWGTQIGGGVDVGFGGGRALRTQVDVPFYFNEGHRLDALRFTTGIVLPLK